MTKRLWRTGILLMMAILLRGTGEAQIHVFPHWVNINTTGTTTAFLTFDGATGYTAGEAIWCGEIMDAAPDIGQKPMPGTIFGSLPLRLDLSSTNPNGVFTDIMSIPPSVSRRAYQAAVEGARSTFFYVRHFINSRGGPDQFVAVTCELAGGGAHTPLAVTGIALGYADGSNVATVSPEKPLSRFSAEIEFTGTGQLHGRWEVVMPGDVPPTDKDLLTESTLPVEQRGAQRSYTEIERFSVFLPPTGKFVLDGPNPAKFPSTITGQYLVLLRIETSLDVESTSDFATSGVAGSPVEAGGVAGFPIPPLRYFVEHGTSQSVEHLNLVLPQDMTEAPASTPVTLEWTGVSGCTLYDVVVIDPKNTVLLSALVRPDKQVYRLDRWLWTKTSERHVDWSVQAVREDGSVIARSEWRTLWRGESGSGQ